MGEVDVSPSLGLGRMGMKRGEQAAIEAPGSDEKRHLAGSIHRRTGRAILAEGRPRQGRGAARPCRHRDDLRRAPRHFKVIRALCDNAGTRTAEGSKLVRAHLAERGHRVRAHCLPESSPGTGPIERAWRRPHEAVARSQRCQTMAELLDLTLDWLGARPHFRARPDVHTKPTGK
jgi:hypothetical protein